jgi:hypothetical protein
MNAVQELFTERICTKCGESWPADTEFFYIDKNKAGGLSNICKACFEDMPSVRAKRARTSRLPMPSSWERLFSDQR